jgi:hypothetical protein
MLFISQQDQVDAERAKVRDFPENDSLDEVNGIVIHQALNSR